MAVESFVSVDVCDVKGKRKAFTLSRLAALELVADLAEALGLADPAPEAEEDDDLELQAPVFIGSGDDEPEEVGKLEADPEEDPAAPYGYCPFCAAIGKLTPGAARTRSLHGFDSCGDFAGGVPHRYESHKALTLRDARRVIRSAKIQPEVDKYPT